MNFIGIVQGILGGSGYANITWQEAVMLIVAFVLMYMAIVKQFEPLLLLPIAFGIFMSNLPNSGTFKYFYSEVDHWYEAGILGVMYMGVKSSFFPCMMFLAVGAMTDFGPLIANPISLLLGAAAQLGIYCAFTFDELYESTAHSFSRMPPACSLRSRRQPSASSAVLTARPPSTLRTTWRRSWSLPSPWRLIPTWR